MSLEIILDHCVWQLRPWLDFLIVSPFWILILIIALQLTKAEQGEKWTYDLFLGNLLAVVFPSIGIWLTHPRVQIYQNKVNGNLESQKDPL